MAASGSVPPTMRAWQYTSTRGGIESNLKLNSGVPVPKPKANQHLVKVLAVGLNPVDFKPAEAPWFSALMIKKPATPGVDFSGVVVTPAAGSPLKAGQIVFGVGNNPVAGGMLRVYSIAEKDAVLPLPENMTPAEGAAAPVCAVTAYQSIKPRVKQGDRIFLNGGSGGTGTFGIQIAKALGLDCTVTCSGRNVELCKSIGADEVIDYTQGNVVEALKKSAEGKQKKYDLIVDNVFSDTSIFYRAHEFTTPQARYVNISLAPTVRCMWEWLKIKLIPAILGGGRLKAEGLMAQPVREDFEQIRTWMAESKVKAVIDSKYPFEQAPEAFKKLKTYRAVGKVIVEVAEPPT